MRSLSQSKESTLLFLVSLKTLTLCSALTTLSCLETRVLYPIVWLKHSIQSWAKGQTEKSWIKLLDLS